MDVMSQAAKPMPSTSDDLLASGDTGSVCPGKSGRLINSSVDRAPKLFD
jgi:hypothetical protein